MIISNNGMNRRCTNRTTINGIDMPVGLIVAIDVMNIHYMTRKFGTYYKRHPLAYLSFGLLLAISILLVSIMDTVVKFFTF